MKQLAYFILLSLITVICICFIALNVRSVRKVSTATIELQECRKTIAELEGQIKKAGSDRDLANQQLTRLESEVKSLIEQRKADQKVIENLREKLQQPIGPAQSKDTSIQSVQSTESLAAKPQEKVEEVEQEAVKYDADIVREMMSSAGGLEETIRRIVTAEGIGSTLQQHSDKPAHWVAAASLVKDPDASLDYLEQAAELYPDSSMALASLIGTYITADRVDESTMAYIDQMKKVDPTNALADCYAAYCQFTNGDVEGALQSLSQASIKDRFADDSIDLLMARNDYFISEGCSEPVALGLSAFDLPLSHMNMLRELSEYAMVQADTLYGTARYEDALQIVNDISKLGGTLSSSGRFIVSDRVGITLQIAALERAKQLYEAVGDIAKSTEIDSQLQAVGDRSETIDIMVQAFGPVMANMGEQELADYVNSTILNGEFSTLQNIPEIATALEQVRKQREESAETGTP